MTLRMIGTAACAVSLLFAGSARANTDAAIADALIACQEHGYITLESGNIINPGIVHDFFADNCPALLALDLKRENVREKQVQSELNSRQKRDITNAISILNNETK